MKEKLWKKFETYALSQGINLREIDDYGPWFDCFISGAQAIVEIRIEEQKNETTS